MPIYKFSLTTPEGQFLGGESGVIHFQDLFKIPQNTQPKEFESASEINKELYEGPALFLCLKRLTLERLRRFINMGGTYDYLKKSYDFSLKICVLDYELYPPARLLFSSEGLDFIKAGVPKERYAALHSAKKISPKNTTQAALQDFLKRFYHLSGDNDTLDPDTQKKVFLYRVQYPESDILKGVEDLTLLQTILKDSPYPLCDSIGWDQALLEVGIAQYSLTIEQFNWLNELILYSYPANAHSLFDLEEGEIPMAINGDDITIDMPMVFYVTPKKKCRLFPESDLKQLAKEGDDYIDAELRYKIAPHALHRISGASAKKYLEYDKKGMIAHGDFEKIKQLLSHKPGLDTDVLPDFKKEGRKQALSKSKDIFFAAPSENREVAEPASKKRKVCER